MEARRIELDIHSDSRGDLIVAERPNITFDIKRVFFITHPGGKRGGHGHRTCEQVIACLTGECTIDINHGKLNARYYMHEGEALYIPTRHFISMYDFKHSCVLAVLCSRPYDPDDYIYP